ncbi:MAG: DNA polymerase III subunit delta [Ruminococcus sp.]
MVMKEREIKKHIKDKKFEKLYCFYGTEKFLVKTYTQRLVTAVMGENPPEFNFHNLGNNSSIDDIAVSADIMPFMSEYNCVKVTDLNIETLVKADFEKLKEVIKNIPDTTVIIFTFPTLEISGKNFSAFIKAVDKLGVAVELPKYDSNALSKQLVSGAYKRGCPLTAVNAGKIVDYCGTDLTLLQNELDKLCAYADGQEITAEMIDSLVHINLETKVYYMANDIIAGNLDKAYKELDILFYQKTEPIAIVSAIAGAYMDLYRARVGAESGVPVATVAKDFSYGNRKFALEKASRAGKRISTPALRKSIDEILSTDYKLKSTSANGRTLLEKLIAKLSLISKEKDYA